MSHRAVILTTHSMDEAEALCKRIAIMVNGQIRALGTKQHLKNKFGSGFELVLKLVIDDMEKQTSEMLLFIQSLFPSVKLVSENGGLLTFRVPKEEMKLSVAFSQLEAVKEKFHIENYSVAQPSLEQVFIRTVNKFSDNSSSFSSDLEGVSAEYAEERLSLADHTDNIGNYFFRLFSTSFYVFSRR